MRIKRREFLVILLVMCQFGCMTLGVMWAATWLRTSFARSFESSASAEGRAIGQQIANRLVVDQLDELEPGSRGWSRLQRLCQQVDVPYDGFVCVIRRDTGMLLCHPRLDEEPKLLRRSYGALSIVAAEGTRPLLDAIRKADVDDNGSVAGTMLVDGDLCLAAAASLPQANAVLLVLQRSELIEKAVAQLVGPMQQIGWIFSFAVVGATSVLTVVLVNRYEDTLSQTNQELEGKVRQRTQSLLCTRNAVTFGLAKLAESRDKDTGLHLDRIRSYVTILANELARNRPEINHQFIADLAVASSLHDIGKVGIPDAVLLKPGRLTASERRAMELHTLLGSECLAAIQKQLGEDDFLELARSIALSHHEHWDGGGYPHGLVGSEIPLSARIVALADVYDALTTARPYKRPICHAEARDWIATRYGTQFDPEVVEAFIAREAEFRRISEAYFGNAAEEPDKQFAAAERTATAVVQPLQIGA